jgi:hypothetical protein
MHVQKFVKAFHNPDPRFSPAPIWWWSGERLEINRLRWQMDQLRAVGICNVVILNLAPSGPLFGSDADDPPFLSDEWWGVFEEVCAHAREIGLSIWFYDQIGFSGANYQAELVAAHPEFAAEQIRIISIGGTGSLRLQCPGAGAPFRAYVLPLDGPDDVKQVRIDGCEARVEVASPSKLCLVYTVRQGYDYFSHDACQKLLDTVHRQFEKRLPQHLGTTIVGSFQDELPDLPTWGRDFADRFGPVIHHLFEPGGAEARRTRLHYHQHRASLAEEALFKPFFQWHEEHGIQCGFDQQSPAREARAIGCVQKYADYIQTHRWYAAPGCDLHGNGKLHASIAYLYDRPRVWIEGFHSTGWGGTIADTFDWLLPFLQSGSNLYNPHAVYYSTRMGWWEWAPPSTCWRQPYARHYRGFAEMICRLTKLLSHGVQQADVAILFPTATVQSAMTPQAALPDAKAADETLHKLIGSMKWHDAKLGVLDSIPLDFHILDDAAAATADVSDGAMTCRDVAFRTIVLPHITMADGAVIANLRRFAEAGGRIVAIGSAHIETPAGQVLDIRSLPNALFAETPEAAGEILRTGPRTIRAPVPLLHRKLDDLHILFVPATSGMTTQVKWADWFANLETATHHPERYVREAQLRLPPSARSVWRFDPIDASSSQLSVSNDGSVNLDFDEAPFSILVWSESDQQAPTRAPSPARLELELKLSTTWSAGYVPTLPTEYTDTHDPRRPELTLPHTAELRWMRGEGDKSWSRGLLPDARVVRAGFGVNGWIVSDNHNEEPRPLVYSPKFGITQDPIHLHRLGPKGHVPEEFIDVGKLERGQSAIVRSGVESDRAMPAVLAIGANARKSLKINGQHRAAPEDGAYLWWTPVDLKQGINSIELKLTAERAENVRAFWCLLRPGSEERFARPERIVPPGEPLAGASLVYRRALDLNAPLKRGRVQVAAAAVLAVHLDAKLLGRQGGFDPYWVHMRGQAYELPALAAGRHELTIELVEPQNGAALLVDLRATDSNGRELTCISKGTWQVSRNAGEFAPVELHSNPVGDAASWHLYRRPHALPGAAWIEGQQPNDVVLDLPLAPPINAPETQWFEWTIPPGATSMQLSLEKDAQPQLWVNDREIAVHDARRIELDRENRAARRAVLRVVSNRLAGGVLLEPVFYQFEQGAQFQTGSWLAQGLRSYSGAVRMRQAFRWDGEVPQSAVLDLGRVRGTVEAWLNGKRVGERFLSPFRLAIDKQLQRGDNELELIVTNTLGNFLSTWSPTRGWSPDQFEAGVLGPVRLRW